MRGSGGIRLLFGVALLSVCAATPPIALAAPHKGSPGVGDAYYPAAGNGGYDVTHYDLQVEYDPASNRLDGVATIRARAKRDLTRFNLDLVGLELASVEVNGRDAGFERAGQELVITPADRLERRRRFTTRIAYGGEPMAIAGPFGDPSGWIKTLDGGWVASEPVGSPTWFPCNDHPRDKATFRFTATVPSGHTAVANGQLESSSAEDGQTTFVWAMRQPMASYLATMTTGFFQLDRADAGGIPSWVAIDPFQSGRPTLNLQDRIAHGLGILRGLLGEYPFDSTGAIVDWVPGVFYALETQTRPVFPFGPDDLFLIHELGHEWFGNSVSVARWRDIWLNEGFATWIEWYFTEVTGGDPAAQTFDELYSVPAEDGDFWTPPPGNPGGPDNLFESTIYVRGGMALQALRQTIGDRKFFRLLRAWVRTHRYGNATIKQFIALAEEKSGRELGRFFEAWLFNPAKPAESFAGRQPRRYPVSVARATAADAAHHVGSG